MSEDAGAPEKRMAPVDGDGVLTRDFTEAPIFRLHRGLYISRFDGKIAGKTGFGGRGRAPQAIAFSPFLRAIAER
jgi:hypothetical protein